MYTVVVADDEYELRRAIIETVDWNSIGFEVIGEAENGAEALDLVEHLEPDLLMTDIKMPFITGIDLARKVREIRPSMQIVFLSGYDDFQYAQQAIQYNIIKYLLKPISSEQLHVELSDIKRVMDERQQLFFNQRDEDIFQLRIESFLMSFLLDNTVASTLSNKEKETLNKQAYALHLCDSPQAESQYIVLVARFLDSEQQVITNHQHVHALNVIAGKHLHCGSFYSQGKIVTVLGGMEWEIDKYTDIIANEIIQTAKRVMNQDCYIGVGSSLQDLTKAHLAYSEACSAIEYGQGANRNLSFIYDIERKDTLPYEYLEGVAIALERLIKISTEDVVENFITAVFIDIHNLKVNLSDVDLLIMHITSRTCTLIRSLCDDVSVQEFFARASEVSALISKHTLEEKRKDITDLCVLCKESINKQNRLNGHVICDELMELINQEYDKEDFSLTTASERLFISASYLSALIKKITGESFVVLLTKKRMEVAKEKVLYSTTKILEIARLCGYSDQHYFSYCFKRQFGVSPNKMREQQANEK